MRFITSPRGFTLVETLVATGILITALAGLAQLFILSTQLTRQANLSGTALMAAQSKLETLSSLTFGYDASGAAVTHPALQPSPSSSLDAEIAPYVDWIDRDGQQRDRPHEAMFARRWRIIAIDEGSPDSVAIEVCAFRLPAQDVTSRGADACLSTVRTRQP